MDQTLDRRIRRTKDRLRQALVTLLSRQELRDIKVSELCKLADIGRGTFYLHYKDIGDFYSQIENVLLSEFEAIMQRYFSAGVRPVLDSGIEEIFTFLAKNADICSAVLSQRESTLVERILDKWKPQDEGAWQLLMGPIDPVKREETYTFIASGVVGIIREWYKAGMQKSPAVMADTVNDLISRCTLLGTDKPEVPDTKSL